jgi:ABC-type glycerol-3-phosphate transport system substrate-binding protein
MSTYKISRRDFLKLISAAGGGVALASCSSGNNVVNEVVNAPTQAVANPVTIDFVSWLPEYDNAYRQIWDVFESENPDIKLNVSAINEDTRAAFDAKVSGGYLPAMKQLWNDEPVTKDNYTNYVNLGEIGFPYFDKWTWDIEHEWSNRFGLPGPRVLDPYAGIVGSFVYHKDIVDDMGWDPQSEVKTYEDLKKFAEDLKLYVEDHPDLDFGWDRAWLNGFTYLRLMNLIPVAWEDGSRERQTACWMGEAKFNAEDSPYRHTFEHLRDVYANGWNPENWWNREWEADMEASFIAKKSVMVVHGHWMWDKTLAGNPDAQLAGFPFPRADREDTILHMEEPFVSTGWAMYSPVQDLPEWEQIKRAFIWWHSPAAVRMRGQAEGRAVLYELDQPLELESAQWKGLLQHVGTDWPDVKLDNGPWGEQSAAPYQIPGTPGPWDRGGGGFNETMISAVAGKISVQEALDVAQANWDKSFEGLPKS